ncbi:hypothetical protein Q4503_02725 [Colwellia sp. 6_MG-2023]|uniref:porin n=1 Tax=Colwellia sp. 6_MG-2023 TaxID=3062676 RepID=UPI0026E19520|nr:porin [Colwellia sp. 6_MG-2023]MDO6486597.1 hypothetical protein [Colwellia sp. 6_MG-2023]
MKKTMIAANVAALLALSVTATQVQAVEFMDGKLKINGAAMQSWQSAIEVDGAARAPEDQDSGFHRLRYALTFNAQVTDHISVFAELAEEPNDNPNFAQDLAWIQFEKDGMGLRVGNVISTTQNFIEYSDGAAVQSNPLIGNSPVDMITAEEGLWLYGLSDNYTWDAVLSKPSFVTDFSKDSGYNFGLRGTVGLGNGFSIGGGIFLTNADLDCGSGNCTDPGGAPIGSLIGVGDGDNYEFGTDTDGVSGTPGRGSHFAIVPGINATIWQLDAQYETDNFKLNAYYGQAQDDYSWADSSIAGYRPVSANFTEQDSEVSFMSVKAKYNINNTVYLAARYSQSTNESTGISGDDTLDRIQLGLGYTIEENVLLKLEYVKQTEEAFSGGQATDGTGEAEWDGIVAELSVTF